MSDNYPAWRKQLAQTRSGDAQSMFGCWWATPGLVDLALASKKPLENVRREGVVKDIAKFVADVVKAGATLVARSYPLTDAEGRGSVSFSWDAGTAEFSSYGEDRHNFHGYMLGEKLAAEVSKVLDEHFTKTLPEGRVYVVIQTAGGPKLHSAGLGASELIRDNYDDRVLSTFDHVTKDFDNPEPCGRLVVMNGPPGAGKTYLIRAMLAANPKATFVVLPPALLQELAGPNLVALLLDDDEHLHKPLILVVEDADQCLSPRSADNMSSISSVLNLTDGILGGVLDLRIVATTNAKTAELDSAISRAGRLCSAMHVEGLSPAKARAVYARLTNGGTLPNNSAARTLLADLYRMARGKDSGNPLGDTKGSVGFKA